MNLANTLRYTAERVPHADALAFEGHTVSYRELVSSASRLAAGLKDLGVDEGDVVATVMKNTIESVEVFWACQWIGATCLPLSWRNPPSSIKYSVEDAGASAVVYEEVGGDHAADLEESVALIGAGKATADRTLDMLKRSEPVGGRFDLPDAANAVMLYTSGTTGRPKGVKRSHRAERAASVAQALQHGYRHRERTLGVMPLYHTMGVHSLVTMAILGGCYAPLPDWDAERAIHVVAKEEISSLYLAPTLFYDLTAADVSSLPVRALGYAGAAMTRTLVERCVEAFQPEVFVNHYGSTEIYCYTIGANQQTKPGNAGLASINARIRVVDMEPGAGPDDLVSPKAEGQIICHMSSDEAFAGYWNRPEVDKQTIRDRWYFTGDLGRRDEDGDYWILGRVDDMIISGGENIHPLEVEDVLSRAAGVREVAVYATPDDRLGQTVTAAIVAEDGVGEKQLDEFCLNSPELARYKRPRVYQFVAELPKSPSGKILRRLLREEETT